MFLYPKEYNHISWFRNDCKVSLLELPAPLNPHPPAVSPAHTPLLTLQSAIAYCSLRFTVHTHLHCPYIVCQPSVASLLILSHTCVLFAHLLLSIYTSLPDVFARFVDCLAALHPALL